VTTPAEIIKNHAVSRLDREASVHRSGHQNVHARRYALPRRSGVAVEVAIIIKGNLQLWCEALAFDRATGASLGGTFRPGSETYAKTNDVGQLLYGRHSALKTMDRLHRGDVWRFTPKTVSDLNAILDAFAA
jgi:hypothetical protein